MAKITGPQPTSGAYPCVWGPEAWQVTAPWQGEVKVTEMGQWASYWSLERLQPGGPGGKRPTQADVGSEKGGWGTLWSRWSLSEHAENSLDLPAMYHVRERMWGGGP